MENQIYRLFGQGIKIELSIVDTNELKPYRDIKELNIDVSDLDNEELSSSELSASELDSLIKYLSDCRDYINDFNVNSLPKKDETE